tara:strand:- start:688 stop:1368 length:681 start_codon:yes stop_codon:yes gene_type:complete
VNTTPKGTDTLVGLGIRVADLVALVQNNTVPRNAVKGGIGLELLAVKCNSIRTNHNMGIRDTIGVVVVTRDAQGRSKTLNLVLPLGHHGLGDNDQGAGEGVAKHGRNGLGSLAEAHLVAQHTARVLGGGLAVQHPLNAVGLVGTNETAMEGLAGTVIQLGQLGGRHDRGEIEKVFLSWYTLLGIKYIRIHHTLNNVKIFFKKFIKFYIFNLTKCRLLNLKMFKFKF